MVVKKKWGPMILGEFFKNHLILSQEQFLIEPFSHIKEMLSFVFRFAYFTMQTI